MSITVTSIKDVGNDVLAVEGVRDARILTAQGWVSATTNHFDAAAYDANGARKQGTTPRSMTSGETLEYARGLLEAQNPLDVPAVVKDLGLVDPDAAAALASVAAREEAERQAAER